MMRSLRLRLLLAASLLASLFMLGLLPTLHNAFRQALDSVIEQRLAADAATLLSAARWQNGRLQMPAQLPDEEFNLLHSKLLGFIYDHQGRLLWQSPSSLDEQLDYQPRFDGKNPQFARLQDAAGLEFFVYDLEIHSLAGQPAALSIVTMQPDSEYQPMLAAVSQQLKLGLGGALLVLLLLLWLGLNWAFSTLRGLSRELDEVESGHRDTLSAQQPTELLRLTDSLNRLLASERRQRERYQDSLGDLAHSLKTPLSVLQGVAEVLSRAPAQREQAQVLNQQVARMSQQVDYQLQRASLRKSGLVRHHQDLGPVLDTLCSALDKVYRDKRVQVSRQFSSPCLIPMEQAALFELLGNLLENAYRLSLGQICVRVVQQADSCQLWIEDDGPGIPADQRARILQRGERLDSLHPGQGIGTAVVVDIIDSYGGTLTLGESALGGASFHIQLPR
ncbi:ATP-binding protein [Atopomonas sediminilitoris]|uniref:ATP-binding protein n=1 Tax=Atopomonas sediminilitoris TaxID=2919919 RepID=UPI001F4E4D9D|nr:ATP-binding protein [Atopomonas sediminilitoris]MCJ8169530.1 ATP-binding protein [Atopomonas sediminilitoris]